MASPWWLGWARQATFSVQQLHGLGNQIGFLEELVKDPQQPDLLKNVTGAVWSVEHALEALDQLRRAQFAYDDAVDQELQ